MKIAIRVDGSPYIGMGHIVRCLALASACERAGHDVIFGSRLEPGVTRIKEQGCDVTVWHSGEADGSGRDYQAAADTAEVCEWLRRESPDALLTDSYRVDMNYFAAVRPLVACHYYIDDVNRLTMKVDGVVNGNIGAEAWDYSNFDRPVRRLLGCRYNLLRQEFRNLPNFEVRERSETILVTAGGGKPGPVLSFLVHSLLESAALPGVKVVVAAPGTTADADELEKYGAVEPRLTLHYNVRDMVSLMQGIDLAISAGGSTVYELCAIGVPRIVYILADNQARIADEMAKADLAVNLGSIDQLTTRALVTAVQVALADRTWREQTSRAGRELVDGCGPDRVVADIGDFLGNNERSGRT